MNGIIVDDFERIIRRSSLYADNVKSDITKIKNNVQTISTFFKGGELNFLNNKLLLESQQLNNVLTKMQDYRVTLNNVLLSYHQQSAQIVEDIKRIMP